MTISDQARPPVNRVAVGRQGMKHPYHIRLVGIHSANCMVTEMESGYNEPGLQFKGGLRAKCFE